MKKVLFPTLLALLLITIVSCDKEEKKPTPSIPANVHLAKEYTITGNDTIMTTYYWDNNVLKKAVTEEEPELNGSALVTATTFNYENGLLKENIIRLTYEGVSVNVTSTFSYENGRIFQFVYSESVYDTIMVIDNFEFDTDGNITKMVNHEEYGNYETLLTWQNGNVVTFTEGSQTYNYTYDNKPNIYTDFPMWKFGKDQFPLYSSKHNIINTNDYDYTYIGDKMVAKIRKSDGAETHYVYTDGTGR